MPEGGCASREPQLKVRALHASYGESRVLHGVDFDVFPGEVVTLLGRNGAGKSTTLKSIMGIIAQRSGSVAFDGVETIRASSIRIGRMGIGYVPEDRGIYASLSVKENLFLPPVVRPGGMPVEKILAMFPNLAARLASQGTKLSGGEQQMLSIARVLRTGAQLLLLDEPTEGLAPVIVEQIRRTLMQLKAAGLTIVLVEQNLAFARSVADRHYVIELGRAVDQMASGELQANDQKLRGYLRV